MDTYIEDKVKEHEQSVYEGSMPSYNKSVLRKQLQVEERFYQNEEREHSHSPVGDRFNMREA